MDDAPFAYRTPLKFSNCNHRMQDLSTDLEEIARIIEPVPQLLKERCHRITQNIIIGTSPAFWGERELRALIEECGVDLFVNLEELEDIYGGHDYYQRYEKVAQQEGKEVQFINFPINDHETPDDSELTQLIEELARLAPSHTIYIHCFGGHGRSGLVSSALLQRLFQVSYEDSMQHLRTTHKQRSCYYSCALSQGSLESAEQRMQATRMESTWKQG
eukprot:m.285640 g.285640  ORF g.285640 m.285640 type:complete len:217 (-) comp16341_c0_seq33:2447-3097(-)